MPSTAGVERGHSVGDGAYEVRIIGPDGAIANRAARDHNREDRRVRFLRPFAIGLDQE
jgi:hypothetical protein